jgi:hypothetical protein
VRRITRRSVLTVTVLVIGLLVLPAYAQVDVETDPPGQPYVGQEVVDLLAPVGQYLSGRPWLLTEGLDPGLVSRPGWDTLTRMDWRALPETFTPPSVASGPFLQAPAAAELVPFRDPAPAFSRDVLVTRDFSQTPLQTEPHLAVNPNDPRHLIVGTIDYNFPSVSSYVSLDGGDIWEGPFQSPFLLDDRTSGGDPVVAFERDGTAHLATISIGIEEFTFGPIVTFSMVSSIAVATSDDGGFSWGDPVSTSRSSVDTRDLELDALGRLRGTLATSFLDKPWMTVGRSPDNPDQDVIYVTYTHFEVLYQILWVGEVPTFLPTSTETRIELVRSEDQGQTWSEPVPVSPTVARVYGEVESAAPGVFGTDRVVQGSQPVVDSDGTVFVAWLDTTDDGSMEGGAEIWVARSDDGGETFNDAAVAAEFEEIGFRPRTAFFRFWGAAFPQIAIGPDGDLYIVYTGRDSERPRDDGDIFLIRSLDGGDSWSEPLRLNDDDGDALQFFPSIDVDPHGTVHVMWGDMRDDPAQTRYHIYYTSSEDQGETWGFELEEQGFSVGDSRVSDFSSNPNFGFPFGLFIGDYFSLKATEEDVYMVWADTRLGEFGGTNQKIAFTRQRPVITPEIFVSPPAGPGGQDITVQGFDFQPNMNVFIQLERATIGAARTDDQGRFETRIFAPITAEGALTLRAFDESGNIASSAYFTEFGFDNLRDIIGWTDVVGGPRADDFLDEIRGLREELTAQDGMGNGAWLAAGALVAFAVSGGAAFFVRRRNNNQNNHAHEAVGEEE